MIRRAFGQTGYSVSMMGFGAGLIGDEDMTDHDVDALLHHTADRGINFFDTARGYGRSEERIGRFISQRNRDELVICTKVGYGVEGYEDWTRDCVAKGIERALRVLQIDHLDVAVLHSCPRHILERYEVVTALEDAKAHGTVRAIGYSGDNEDLEYAVGLSALDVFEGSFNLFDQRVADGVLDRIRHQGKAFIAKRPMANAPWRFPNAPTGHYCEPYWHRMQAMALDWDGLDPAEIAIRFALHHEGVNTGIIGTTRREHIDQNLAYVERGPLPVPVYARIRERFAACNANWTSEV